MNPDRPDSRVFPVRGVDPARLAKRGRRDHRDLRAEPEFRERPACPDFRERGACRDYPACQD